MSSNPPCVVYWLCDDSCVDPACDGYVGITNSQKIRIRAHRRDRRFPTGFKTVVLFEGLREACLIEERRLRPFPGIGWNTASGGLHGRSHLPQTRAKISAARRGSRLSDESRERRKALKPIVTQETRSKMRAAALGRKLGDVAKEKLRRFFKDRPLSVDHRAKISAATMGREFSNETRLKMSEAAKARWIKPMEMS